MDESEGGRLEQRLTERLFVLYDRVGQETGYWANYFLRDLKRLGGLQVARKLLSASAVSAGFERLRKENLLRESVEAVVLEGEFQALFSPTELARARARLAEYGYAAEELSPDPAEPGPELTSLLARVE